MNDEREKLLRVKELVSQKQYDAARVLLRTMPENPTAQKWLAQLDQMAPPLPAAPPNSSSATPPLTSYAPPPPPPMSGSMPAQGPAPAQRRQLPIDEVRQQMRERLTQAHIDINLAVLTLVIAALAGVIAALLDVLLGLPTGALAFRFGWFVPALIGITYPLLRGVTDWGGLAVSAVAGAVMMLIWFILFEVLDNVFMSLFEALLAGILVGMMGFGWYALLPFLRSKVQPYLPDMSR